MSDDRETRYSLGELTNAAGVSIRTVRYYIGEGLLPPPITAGPQSHYTQAHFDRLRLIGRLKTAYLPLREIRRRLTALDDDEVQQLLAEEDDDPPVAEASSPAYPPEEPIDSAASYVSRLLRRQPRQSAPVPQPPPAAGMLTRSLEEPARAPTAPPLMRGSTEFFPDTAYRDRDAEPDLSPWRRIRLGDDAELLIREEAYDRNRARIDWLIGWARKVFR